MDVAFDKPGTAKGPIVDLVPTIKKKQLNDRHRWMPTKEDIDRVAADIWPGNHGPVPEVTSVKGAAPKKPALSREARHALHEIGDRIETIKFELLRLNEHSLKGLEFEALRTATFEDAHLWRAVAAEAQKQRDIRVANRTGKGEWYAVIDATKADGPLIEREIATAHVKCASRIDAIEAGKRLMIEKADWLSPDVRLEVRICSALEWRPGDG